MEWIGSVLSTAGIVLVVSASLLAVSVFSGSVNLVLMPWRQRQFNHAVYKTLSELTQDEKDFLRPFIFGNANTVTPPINDGVAGGLAAKQITIDRPKSPWLLIGPTIFSPFLGSC